MKIKKRTLDELRQTKDSYYVVPRTVSRYSNSSILDNYVRHMRDEQRDSQISLKNFLLYLERNDFQIIKG